MQKLSHSQCSKFQQCPKAYELWYLKKIRPSKFRGALLFGSALDTAITSILMNQGEPNEIFSKAFRFQQLNKKESYLPDNINIIYAEADFDKDLIKNEDCLKLGTNLNDVLISIELRNEKGYENLSDNDKKLVNIGSWICLEKKGYLMIDAFKKQVLPKLKKVYSTQEYIELKNDSGDSVIGYIDIVADVEGYNSPIILDVKTAARQYKEGSVLTSPQLTLYVHAVSEKYNTRKAGFVVFNKNIVKNRVKICSRCGFNGTGGRHKTCANEISVDEYGKWSGEKLGIKQERCNGAWIETIFPEVSVQFMVDEIPQETEDLVLENIDDINISIKTGHFTRNLNTCTNNFGGLCDYINLCYKGNMDNLETTDV